MYAAVPKDEGWGSPPPLFFRALRFPILKLEQEIEECEAGRKRKMRLYSSTDADSILVFGRVNGRRQANQASVCARRYFRE